MTKRPAAVEHRITHRTQSAKPALALIQGESRKRFKRAKPAPYNPSDTDTGEHEDVDLPEGLGATAGYSKRGVYEDRAFAGLRRFIIVDSRGMFIRIIEEPVCMLATRTHEQALYSEMQEWLDVMDPIDPVRTAPAIAIVR